MLVQLVNLVLNNQTNQLMKIKIMMLLSVLISLTSFAQTGSISGVVVDATTQEPLMGTNIVIRGTNTGVSSDENGNFSLKNLQPQVYLLDVFYIGYQSTSQEVVVTEGGNVTVNFSLTESSSQMDEIVLSASRRPQKVTRAPATVSIISSKEIADYAGNPGELAARQKGVDFVRSGVQGTGINIRGFNSAFNSKNLQVEDGRISTLVATGLPFGSFTTITKDDIERVEIILGPNAALYGPNAHNGLVATLTKDPRTSEGTDIAVAAGNQEVFSARLRHAMKLGDKFAFKVWGEQTQGKEFDCDC